MNYEQAQARMPEGWTLWGNHGDGLWRAGPMGGDNQITPCDSIERALTLAHRAIGSDPIHINRSTADYQMAAIAKEKSE